MIKITVFMTSIVALLSACNDNNDDDINISAPAYKEPKIIIVGHRGASAW